MMRAAAFAALVLLFVVAGPRDAFAHGGVQHGAATAQGELPASAPHIPAYVAAVASPSCPGDHEGVCTCGSALACPGAKPGAVIAACMRLAFMLLAPARPAFERKAPRAPPRAFSLQFSRAPPARS